MEIQETQPDTRASWSAMAILERFDLHKWFKWAIATLIAIVTILGVRLNLAIALLANGQYDDAKMEYDTVIARSRNMLDSVFNTSNSINPEDYSSLNFDYYLEAGITDLQNLIDRITEHDYSFTQAPHRDAIIDPDETLQEAKQILIDQKSKLVGLKYWQENGKPLPDNPHIPGVIQQFAFGAAVMDQAEFVFGDQLPGNTKYVGAIFNYDGIQKGQHVIIKVYHNLQHLPEYDTEYESWQGDESGELIVSVTDALDVNSERFTLANGPWSVEVYVDGNLIGVGYFTIGDEDGGQ